MSQRLEVMLTGRQTDGTWTWRVAGARQPKGVLSAELLPRGAAVGDVLRVEAEIGLDGIAVRQVLPTKAARPAPARVEHLGSGRFTEGVIAPKKFLDGEPDGSRDRQRRDRGRGGPRGRSRAPGRDGDRGGPEARGGQQRAPRLRASTTHRDAWLETLSATERPLAERLAKEGIRAVRQSVQAEADGPESQEQTLAGLETLFSAFRTADWRDRAEEAKRVSDTVDLRDLRSVVAGAPQTFEDEESRALADEVRSLLESRVDREHTAWIADLGSLERKGRMVTALRVSRRPPKTGTPLPESLARTLTKTAGAQLDAETSDDLWVRMLEAAAQSPIRLVLVAAEVPDEPSERLLRGVKRYGDRLPELRAQFAAHLEPAEAAEADKTSEPAEADGTAQADEETEGGEAAKEDLEQSTAGADAFEELTQPDG